MARSSDCASGSPQDEFLGDLVHALRDELAEVLVRNPERALDARLLYQLEDHERRVATYAVAGSRSTEGLRQLVREVARLEVESFLSFPRALCGERSSESPLPPAFDPRHAHARPGIADLDPTLSIKTFVRVQDEGIHASIAPYERLLESAGRAPVLPWRPSPECCRY